MRTPVKTGIATAALLATSFAAQAADIPRPVYKSARAPIIAYYNWTGFYVGANAGYGFGSSTWDVPAVKPKPKGGVFGATVGYNWQSGAFVYGLEGDYDWSMIKGGASCLGVLTCETKNSYLATFRGRVGYAFDRWLPYVTGGGAYGNVKASIDPGLLTASKAELGWTFGAGLEYAFLGNWTAKIEYLYVDLGKFDTKFTAPTVDNVTFKESLVRLGLNYRFSGPVSSQY